MDETQHFCLRWNNYQSSITSAFENLRDDEDFVDVTLACEGRSIKAHRVVLSACSPYFRDLLKSTPCKHPVILLQDVNFMDLHSLVEFIYHGEVNVHQKSLQSFLKTAEVLRVSGLTQQQAEDTHSHLAQIQNLANAGVRTPLNSHSHHGTLHDDAAATLFSSRQGAGSPPPPSQLTHINNHLLKRMAMMQRGTSVVDEASHALKRLRSADNGLPSSNNNSPDLQLHTRSTSPQLTPADFSTIKHHNNNNTPPLKDDKRNGPTGNGNSGNTGNSANGNGNTNGNGNGISINEKLGSLTPSPLARGVDDVKSEPMELVCSNNNVNTNVNDEHSNDSTGEHDANRSTSGDGGKGSLSSVNDDEISDNLAAHHATQPFIMSPAENKLFPGAAFNFQMSNLDHPALLGLNTQLQQSGELAVSPQGNSPKKLFSCQLCGKLLCSKASLKRHIADKHAVRQEEYRCAICERVYCSRNSLMTHIYTYHKSRPGPLNIIRSAATSPTSSTSSPPSPPTAMTSPTSSLKCSLAAAVYNLHTSPPRPGSVGSTGTNNLCFANANGTSNNNSQVNVNANSNLATSIGVTSGPPQSGNGVVPVPQLPLRMPPPTSGGINEPQECPYCRRTFSCYYSLKRHFQDKHEQSDTLYVCEFCHRRYRTKNSLTTHKSLQHRGSSGMLKRLLKTSAIKHGLVTHAHQHHHALSHSRTSLFDFKGELGHPPPGIQ